MPARRGVLVAIAIVVLALVAAACGARPEQRTLAPAVPMVDEILETAAPPDTTVAPTPVATAAPVDLPGEDLSAPVRPRAARAPRSAGARSGPQVTGRIEIPKIGLSHTTYEGVSLAVLKYGPGHWPGTPMPGHAGNSVFPGHRTTHSRPFWDVDKLAPGDHIIFTTAEGRFVYEVFDSLIVRANEVWIVNQTSDARVTIFGCHPKGSAKYRYVVRGRLVGTPLANGPRASSSPSPQQPPPQQAPPPPPPTTTTTAPRGRNCIICL